MRDAKALARVFADFDVTKTTGTWPHPVTEEFARWRLQQWLKLSPPEQIGFSVQFGQTIIGQVGMHHVQDGHYTIGWTIGKDWWGQGYGTEAVRALCHHGFRAHRVRSIEADIFTTNAASIAVAGKSGFRPVGEEGEGWSTTLCKMLPVRYFRRDTLRPS